MAFQSTATRCILAILCVYLAKDTSVQCEPSPVLPIAPFGPLGAHVAPGPVEFVAVGPAPTEDLLVHFGSSVPRIPSAIEGIDDLVSIVPGSGCTFAHVSSFASPVQVNVNKGPISTIPGQSLELVEPVVTIETAQCGCTVIRLYWIHEVVTLCPLGTGRWAKTQVLGQAELKHEWVLSNTHDIKQPAPCPVHSLRR